MNRKYDIFEGLYHLFIICAVICDSSLQSIRFEWPYLFFPGTMHNTSRKMRERSSNRHCHITSMLLILSPNHMARGSQVTLVWKFLVGHPHICFINILFRGYLEQIRRGCDTLKPGLQSMIQKQVLKQSFWFHKVGSLMLDTNLKFIYLRYYIVL